MFIVIMTNWYRSPCWHRFGEFNNIEDAIARKEKLEKRWHPFATVEILTEIERGWYRPAELS